MAGLDHSMVLIIMIVSLAGFVQGMTGFGFGLVAMPLLPLLMNLRAAVALAVLLNVVVTATTFLKMRVHYSWRRGLGLVLGSCLGVPVGVYVLIQLNESLLRHILGGVMCLFAANELLLSRKRTCQVPRHWSFPFGLISGGLGGAFNMGGPPAVAFAYSQPWSKEQIVAVLQVVFGLSTLLRIALLGSAGILEPKLLSISAWGIVPLILAILAGSYFFSRIARDPLRKGVFLFLGAMGIKYLLFA